MTHDTHFPKLDRTIKPVYVFLFSCMFYVVMLPMNWLMVHVFRQPGILIARYKRQQLVEEKVLVAFGDYTPTSHDIFVNTFSKSGTNWMMQMAQQIAFLGEGDVDNIYDVVPWPELYVQVDGKMTIPLDDKRVQEASPTGLRVIKTHLKAQHIPWCDEARYITVIRDPKDAFVSSYHFARGVYGGLTPDVETWLNSFLSPHFAMGFGGNWARHTASHWALRHKPNVLVLSFRDMKKDLQGTIKKVAAFLGVTLTEDQLAKVTHKCSFDYMRANNHRFFPIAGDAFPWMNAQMVRTGKEGASGELLSPEQQRHIDTHFITELKALDSDFPYEEFCRVSY